MSTFPISSDLHDNSGRSIRPLAHALWSNLRLLSVHRAAIDVWVVEMAVLAVVAAAVVVVVALRASTARVHERLAFAFYAVQACLLTSYVWSEVSDLRVLVEVYPSAAVVLIGAPRRLHTLAGLLTLPLAFVVMHRIAAL